MKRKAIKITDKNLLDMILDVNEDDITLSYIMELFGDFDGKAKVQPYDIIDVPPGKYGPEGKKNKNTFTTTVGLYIVNKFFFEQDLVDVLGYYNKPISDKEYGKISKKLSYAYMEDDITLDQLQRFLNKTQKFMPFVSIIASNITMDMMYNEEINKKKKELLKKYDKEIKAGDGKAVEKLEKELLSFAKETLKDDPSSDCFESGARGSWGNQYKNMFLLNGAVKSNNPDEERYNIITDNYMDGISAENYSTIADSLVAGPMGRAKKTAIGGYMEKQFVMAFQHIVINHKVKDCGTKNYIEVYLTPKNIDSYMYSYIIDNGKIIELTSKNMDKYLNTKVKIRFSSMCKCKNGICETCAGNLFTRLGVDNIGVATSILPSILKNIQMKGFHNSTVTFIDVANDMDLNKIFGLS